jgi:hypothetical protein
VRGNALAMTETQSPAEPAPTNCSSCGRKSTLHEAFVRGKDGTILRVWCPPCAERRAFRYQLFTLVASALLVLWSWTSPADNSTRLASVVVLAYGVFYLSLALLAVPHELAHALTGQLVGIRPMVIAIGGGRLIVDRKVCSVRFRIGRCLSGGATYFDLGDGRWRAGRMIALTAAGPLMNVFIGAIALLVAGSAISGQARLALWIVAAASLFQALANLWPTAGNPATGKLPSDGAQILKYLRGDAPSNSVRRDGTCVLHALLAYADRDFIAVVRHTEAGIAQSEDPNLQQYFLALKAEALCELDEPSKALDLLGALPALVSEQSQIAPNAAYAWACLLTDRPELMEDALARITQCASLLPWNAPLLTKRACLLAVTAAAQPDRLGTARGLLVSLVDLDKNRECRAYVALAGSLVAVAEGNSSSARKLGERARALGAAAAAMQLLERRLASR